MSVCAGSIAQWCGAQVTVLHATEPINSLVPELLPEAAEQRYVRDEPFLTQLG